MCGRYSLRSSGEKVAEEFQLDERPSLFTPRFNIAPSMQVLVIGTQRTGRRRIARTLRWGIDAPWQRKSASSMLLSQARVETLAQKRVFRSSYEERRCLLAADGFYEWKKLGKDKQPYYVQRSSGGLLGIAALWERYENSEGQSIVGCVLLTQEADVALAEIHHRMPVVLSPKAYAAWLDPDRALTEELDTLLASHALRGADFAFHRVSKEVNSTSFDEARAVEAIED